MPVTLPEERFTLALAFAREDGRVYTIDAGPFEPSLFPELGEPYTLTVRWGREGRELRTMRESYETKASLVRRVRDLVRRRLRHGYLATEGEVDAFRARRYVRRKAAPPAPATDPVLPELSAEVQRAQA